MRRSKEVRDPNFKQMNATNVEEYASHKSKDPDFKTFNMYPQTQESPEKPYASEQQH